MRTSRIAARASLTTVVLLGMLASATPGLAAKPTCPRKGCPAAVDTTPPVVAINAPLSGSSVGAAVTLSGTASDQVQVTRVEVQVDGGSWQLATGTSTWSSDVSGLAIGPHSLAARATDSSGNSSTASVGVTVAPAADTTAPTVAISSPVAGSTVAGLVTVSGIAADDYAVSRVEVRVDSAPWQPMTGTTSWSGQIDAGALAEGAHTLTARATDAAGLTASNSISIVRASGTVLTNGEISATDTVIQDASAPYGVVPVGRSKMASDAKTTVVLYAADFTNRRGAYLRDVATGASSYVSLPIDVNEGWSNASYTLSTNGDLWVSTGGGPLRVRQYRLTGTPLATSATLVSSTVFGDTDSRPGDLLALASGAVVHVWHQQGATGPQGLWVSRHAPGGAWSPAMPVTFSSLMPTNASKQALVQHPADGSIWLFNSTDGWGRVGGARLTESSLGLTVDWTNPALLDPQTDGTFGPDPEDPDLAAVPDPYTGTVAVAYQSATRQIFRNSPFLAGSHVVVARFTATGQKSFSTLPTYVERISALGLSITGPATWLFYRPVDVATMTFDRLVVARLQDGAWSRALDLGSPLDPYARVGYLVDRPELSVRLSDGRLHLFSLT